MSSKLLDEFINRCVQTQAATFNLCVANTSKKIHPEMLNPRYTRLLPAIHSVFHSSYILSFGEGQVKCTRRFDPLVNLYLSCFQWSACREVSPWLLWGCFCGCHLFSSLVCYLYHLHTHGGLIFMFIVTTSNTLRFQSCWSCVCHGRQVSLSTDVNESSRTSGCSSDTSCNNVLSPR